MNKHPLVFGGVSFHGVPTNLALAALRIMAGCGLALIHGWKKLPPSASFVAGVEGMGFPLPEFFAWAATLSEFGCALLVAVGLVTRPAAFFVTVTMGVAAFVRLADADFATRELALLYGAIFLLFTVAGAGRFSVDALVRRI